MLIRARIDVVALAAAVSLVGCAKSDTSSAAADSPAAAPAATPAPAPAPPAAAGANDTIVRGSVVSISDTALTLGMAGGGDAHVALTPPVQVYARENADLSKVTERSFVGVTSVAQPDGSQRATEIHIFPEELRGLGEGSRPMGQPSGGGSKSTMTNGTVAAGAGGGSRMTNGAVRTQAGGTITVEYQGGTQTIAVPAGVSVTAIAPTTKKVTPGANVIVLGKKRPDGGIEASRVMLAPGR
jgi:hypothetical protein